ncbi:hypothetical protein ACFT8W_20800 [Streptomyces hygroscopicus]|uniref:hypothetical protein n=1 Tax=Streptomyces hygroscopicus TaxID=1912 RepID=UPI0036357B1E
MLLLSWAPPAVADEPQGKTLAECSVDDVLGKKDGCFELYTKECIKDGKANDSNKDCKRLNEGALQQPPGKGPSAGEKLCKGNKSWACKGIDGISEGARKADKAITHPVDTLASAAFDAVAGKFGDAAVKILNDLTEMFLRVSTIKLENTGILDVYSITWALSALVALLLVIWQLAKAGISGEGSSVATAVTGLAKWMVICAASLAVTQAALGASDEISNWIIDVYGKGDGQAAFRERMNAAFAFGGLKNTALILLMGILAALFSLILWFEMILRQVAIQVLVASLPIAAAGGIMQATREWIPKARNAVIALILVKPIIVLIFVIGFTTTGQAKTLRDVVVGIVTICTGAVAWPTLAKFFTFTSVGSGGGLASGLLSAAGGTAGSMFGYGGGVPSGPGAAGGGRNYTQALQGENDSSVAQAGVGGGRANRFAAAGKLGAAAMALQGAKAGKEVLEAGMEAMAAHADLGPGKDMGGQINIPPPGGESGQGGDTQAPPPPPPPPPGPSGSPPPRVELERGASASAVTGGDTPPAVEGGRTAAAIPAPPVRPALPPAPRAVDGSEG